MSISTSRLAYADCREFLDRALEDPKGARLWVGTEDKAIFFRMRCNQARQIERAESARLYPRDDPKWGVCAYDILTLRLKSDVNDEWYVYAEKSNLDLDAIEPLSEIAEIEYTEVKLLEHQTEDDNGGN